MILELVEWIYWRACACVCAVYNRAHWTSFWRPSLATCLFLNLCFSTVTSAVILASSKLPVSRYTTINDAYWYTQVLNSCTDWTATKKNTTNKAHSCKKSQKNHQHLWSWHTYGDL